MQLEHIITPVYPLQETVLRLEKEGVLQCAHACIMFHDCSSYSHAGLTLHETVNYGICASSFFLSGIKAQNDGETNM